MRIFRINNKIMRGLNSVLPDRQLLTNILKKLPTDNTVVTNLRSNRINLAEEKINGSRHLSSSKIISFINIMSKSVKIMSGGAVVAALIVALVLITGDNKYSPIIESGQSDTKTYEQVQKETPVTETSVAIAGETVDVDSLIVDLVAADYAFDEPAYDDSDLTAELINSNYEIQ